MLLIASCVVSSCNKDVTYAEMRETEKKQVENFLKNGCHVYDAAGRPVFEINGAINPITEEVYEQRYKAAKENGYEYDMTARNEYIQLDNGVYIQIVDYGTGHMYYGRYANEKGEMVDSVRAFDKVQDGTTRRVLVRYTEYNIAGDSIQSSNIIDDFMQAPDPDEMSVVCSGGAMTGTLVKGVMYYTYSASNVPNSWLYPLFYVNLGRYIYKDSRLAHVRLIVPSVEGQTNAQTAVYPCAYELYYEAGERVSPNALKK